LRRRKAADSVGFVTFSGWPASALAFYAGLEADNSKAYWSEHRAVYEADVLAPMNALLAELAAEFGEGKLFRPYRDIRFSADKSPYKTTIAAVLPRGGFIQLSAAGLDVGRGSHGFAADQLERYRMAVADDHSGEELRRLIADAEAHGIRVAAHERLTNVPRGYPKDHPRGDLLRAKDLVARRQWPDADWLHTGAAKTRIVTVLRQLQPFGDWLDTHVGHSAPTVRPRRRR
jgi:uncharacterized protein (TIGR02453 family)